MPDTRTQSISGPGAPHRPAVDRWAVHVSVTLDSVVIAESGRALKLQEADYPAVYYLPLEDVHQDVLQRSEHHTWCPYKGEASYFDIIRRDGTDELAASVWYYADPFPAVSAIRDHLAFYTDRVTLTATPDY